MTGVTADRKRKRVAEGKRKSPAAPTVRVGAATPTEKGPQRLPDSEGDVGFTGGERPDRAESGKAAPGERERARPRDTGRQGS